MLCGNSELSDRMCYTVPLPQHSSLIPYVLRGKNSLRGALLTCFPHCVWMGITPIQVLSERTSQFSHDQCLRQQLLGHICASCFGKPSDLDKSPPSSLLLLVCIFI